MSVLIHILTLLIDISNYDITIKSGGYGSSLVAITGILTMSKRYMYITEPYYVFLSLIWS
jgi:hypothetical protein